MIDEAIRQWNDGALINIMMHVTTPLRTVEQEKAGASWSGGGNNSVQYNLTTDEWNRLLTDGMDINLRWKQRLDEYAYYLQQLKDAGVVPMFRPFHEMNQNVFWWNGNNTATRNNTAALYRMTKDYLVDVKGLDNMIWMWNVQDLGLTNWDEFNPGDAYWDMLTLDTYSGGQNNNTTGRNYYNQMIQFATRAGGANGPKPIGIGELWTLMNASQRAAFPNYVFSMPWADDTWTENTAAAINEFYRNTMSILDTPTFASRTVPPVTNYLMLAAGQSATVTVRRGFTSTIALDTNCESITYTSAVPMFATVDENGVITGKAVGITVIRITDTATGLAVNVAVNVVN